MGDRPLPPVLVTGAASGIGAAVAQTMSARGHAVGLLDLDSEAATELAASMPRALAVAVDVTDDAAVVEGVGAITSTLGAPGILVNAAGWDRITRFVDSDPDLWDRVLAVNLRGPIAVTHAVLPGMIEAEGGAIVNVASDAGRVGSSGEVVYSAAKGGLIAFTKALAREVARHRVRVNAVAPGPTETPFLDIFGPESGKILDGMRRQTPLRKLATPEDVAEAVAFLASERAGHITGQTLSVSGGLTMI